MASYTDGIYDNSKMGDPSTLCYSLSAINNYFKLESVSYMGPTYDAGNQVVGLLYNSASFSSVRGIGRNKTISIINSTYGGTTVITQLSGASTPRQVSLITKNNKSFTFNLAASGNASDEVYIYSPFEFAVGSGQQNNGDQFVGQIAHYNPEFNRFNVYGNNQGGTYIEADEESLNPGWIAYIDGTPYYSANASTYPWGGGYYGDEQDGVTFANDFTEQLTSNIIGPNNRRLYNLNG